jgi:hypothetical protein
MGEAAAPAWVDDVVGALPGVEELLPAPYWEHSDLHGADSLMHTMHAGPAPALRGVRIFLQRSQRRIHGVWLLGANVCSHPGTTSHSCSANSIARAAARAPTRVTACRWLLGRCGWVGRRQRHHGTLWRGAGGSWEAAAAASSRHLTHAPLPVALGWCMGFQGWGTGRSPC